MGAEQGKPLLLITKAAYKLQLADGSAPHQPTKARGCSYIIA
nr:MAG TPA: hypothetical protein [Bacteriophage sp.]